MGSQVKKTWKHVNRNKLTSSTVKFQYKPQIENNGKEFQTETKIRMKYKGQLLPNLS